MQYRDKQTTVGRLLLRRVDLTIVLFPTGFHRRIPDEGRGFAEHDEDADGERLPRGSERGTGEQSYRTGSTRMVSGGSYSRKAQI